MESNAFAEFWRQLPPGKKIHPADKPILRYAPNSLETKLFPAFGEGPLATAPVVLCYLNHKPPTCPQIVKATKDHEKRRKAAWGTYLAGTIKGTRRPRPLSPWAKKRIKGLGKNLEIATFNILPYRSSRLPPEDRRLAHYLPSARMARNHLHNVLLPAATRGERFIVIVTCSPESGS